jgi:signal peptidase I
MNSDMPMPQVESVSPHPHGLDSGERARGLSRQIAHLLVVGVLGFVCYLLITEFVLQSVRIVGSSMVPTLHDSDRCLLNRWVYHVHPPQRLDIVVLRDPVDNGFSVKRIIGVTGDSVSLKAGRLYVNGEEFKEPYLAKGTATFAAGAKKEQTFVCGPGQFFVLGDNRSRSVDSRTYGPIPRDSILGVIVQ